MNFVKSRQDTITLPYVTANMRSDRLVGVRINRNLKVSQTGRTIAVTWGRVEQNSIKKCLYFCKFLMFVMAIKTKKMLGKCFREVSFHVDFSTSTFMSKFVYTVRRCENWSERCQPYENYIHNTHYGVRLKKLAPAIIAGYL